MCAVCVRGIAFGTGKTNYNLLSLEARLASDDLNDTNLVWIDYPALKLSMIKPPAHIGVREAFAPIDKMQTI